MPTAAIVKRNLVALYPVLCLGIPALAVAQGTDSGENQREEIVVVGTTPLPGSSIDRDKIPGTTQLLTSDDLAANHAITILDALSERIPGLQLGDSQGNGSFQDIHYRGFAASPLQGTPQGIAVYQNGIRLNEAFGDTVNWDMIPEVAIDKLAISSNNPAFGLNAIGGAVNIEMKDGFRFTGLQGEIQGGSYGRVNGSVEYGVKSGDYGLYLAGEAFRDGGYRLFSNSDIERLYADAGYSGDLSEFHLVGSIARSNLGVVGPAPLNLIQKSARAVYTSPQTTRNETGLLALRSTINLTDDLAVQLNVYGSYLGQKHVDGNNGNFEACPNASDFAGDLCLRQDDSGTVPADQFTIVGRQGQMFPFAPDAPYGTLDRTSINTTMWGSALQVTYDGAIWRHSNNFVIGASVDHSDIAFSSGSTLGYIFPNLSVGLNANLPGSGTVIHTLGDVGYAPVGLAATTNYYGFYLADTFDVTSRLSVTAGLRVNILDISTADVTGAAPELNGINGFTHANPEAGLTYKLGNNVTAYGGYSQANRAPTPLELDCANPMKPCLLENSLVSDPPLKQVVADSCEIGLRGTETGRTGRLEWNASLYRTDSDDDIIALASTIPGRGYYANVPSTRRQGLELGVIYKSGPWNAFANYSFVDATYRFNGLLASPNSTSADANGNIAVHSGDRIPGIPRHQIKVGLDYAITSAWSVGADVEYFGSQYLIGDASNQNARLTPYWIANIRSSYQLTSAVQIFAHANNLFDRRYASYGTYFDTNGVGQPITDNLTDARTLTLGQPISLAGGVRVTF